MRQEYCRLEGLKGVAESQMQESVRRSANTKLAATEDLTGLLGDGLLDDLDGIVVPGGVDFEKALGEMELRGDVRLLWSTPDGKRPPARGMLPGVRRGAPAGEKARSGPRPPDSPAAATPPLLADRAPHAAAAAAPTAARARARRGLQNPQHET